jgi:TonB dependent receptor/TonB-dependent Receptor Plug Domain/Gram-negative bacterial TonB protein C-terminal
MVCRWTLVAGLTLLSVATEVRAQSLSLEEEVAPPVVQPEAPPPATPPKPAVIEPPVALSTPLEYPAGVAVEATVLLELTLDVRGAVTEAKPIEGDEPFASAALEASRSWTFRPARRDGKPVAAKIRFQARFVPPREVLEPEPEPEPAPAVASEPGQAPPAAPIEFVVLGERAPIRHELGRVEVERMPGAFGDPYRAIEGLPGVVPIVSGLPYFYVRGAPPGNVGYFFDGIPVPFLYHFAAGPGVFHPAFVERVDLYPGAYPVRYGRFAGAIVAGELAPPSYRTRAEWKVRIIDSGAMVEAPFAQGRGSLMLGGRFSYTGLVLSLIVPEVNVGYWDYQARARYELDDDDAVELVAFGSSDYVTVVEEELNASSDGSFRTEKKEQSVVDVNFHRLDLRWDRQLEQGRFRTAVMVGRDRSGFADGQVNVYNYMVGLRSELQQQLRPGLKLRAGADALFEALEQVVDTDDGDDVGEDASPPSGPDLPPGTPAPQPLEPPEGERDDEEPDFGFDRRRRDFTVGVHADLVWDVTPFLQVTPGLRFDLLVSGRDAALAVDPRVTAEYSLSEELKVTHGLALVHQAPSFVAAVPGFKPSLDGGLQKAVQHSAGLTYELPAGFSSSLALFQSAFIDMTDLISLIQLDQTARDNDDGPIDFRTNGHAYGLELMVRRSLSRKVGGFVSYTLSRSRRFDGRLSGPATTDRTHVLNVAGSADLGRDWRFSSRLLFYSGIPAEVAYVEAARHPPRTPPFWRVDFKLEKRWYVQRPHRYWGLSLEVLNTTLNKEKLTGGCNAYECVFEEIGPVTVPALAFEGAF